MDAKITLTRPDGTPLATDEVPAQGTLLVLQLDEVADLVPGALPYDVAITAAVIGWVPQADPMARTLLGGACRALNKRADYEEANKRD